METEIKNDGGPAFPTKELSPGDSGHYVERYWIMKQGMSLRDWFAGMAMQGLAVGIGWESGRIFDELELANDSYDIADAMLAEREKEKEKT